MMSKLWLLLVLVAAFQAVNSYPALETDDYLEDKGDSTATIIKETWGKLKNLWNEKAEKAKLNAKKKIQDVVKDVKEALCREEDFVEIDFEEDAAGDKDPLKSKLMQKIKELQQKVKKAADEKKLEVLQKIAELRAKLCDSINDIAEEDDGDDNDDERFNFGKFGKNVMKGLKKTWKKLKPHLKKAAKKGAKLLKKHAVKVTPLECDEDTCKTCISLTFLGQSACLKSTISREDDVTYFTISGDVNDSPQFTEKIKLGDVPRCVNAGSLIGNICIKGIEGKGKSSKGKAQVNFCLGFLAEQHGVGVKACASYENKKFKVKLSPKLFAGALDGDEIIEADGEGDNGGALDADEFEID